MGYDCRHRTFLQAVMQNGVVVDQDATSMVRKIFDQATSLSSVSGLINDKLAPLGLSLKSGICEMTGSQYWSVVGTVHEENALMPSKFNQQQKAFLRLVYSEIIGSPDRCVQDTDCLNLVSTIEKFTMGDAEWFLQQLVKQKWLYSKDGSYYMGVRSIIEMMPYFRATYQDHFLNCNLCKEVVFNGQKCDNCAFASHNYCLTKYSSVNATSKCPQCKNDLDLSNLPDECRVIRKVGPENEDEPMDVSDDDDAPRRKAKSKKPKRKAREI